MKVNETLLRNFVNVVVRWNRNSPRLNWLLPVTLAASATMSAVMVFDWVQDLLRAHLSPVVAYMAPLLVVGFIAGSIMWLLLHIYRRMAEETVEEVSARLRISGELTNEKALMRALMDHTPDHIYFKDIDGRYLRINRAMANALGMADPADATGKTEADFLDPGTAAELAAADHTVRATGESMLGREESTRWVDRRESWASATKLPLLDRANRIIGTFGISRDITARKQIELQIRQLSQAVEQSPSLVLITNHQGAITYVNPKFSALTGYTADEVLGRNPRILKGEGVSNQIYQDMWDTITAGGVWTGEILNRKKNGESFWGLASISPIRNAENRVTHYLEVMEDITQRKYAEQALRRQFAFQRQLIDAMPIPIFLKDRDGRYQECNEAFAQFLGLAREQILGRTVFDLSPPDLADRYHQHDLDLIRSGGLQRYEVPVLHADGTRHQVVFTKALVHDDKGEQVGLVGAIVDFTDLRQTQAALKEENLRRSELEEIVNKSPAIVFLWRAEPGWPVEYVTDSVSQLGYTPEDFVAGGLPFCHIVHPDDLPRVAKEVEQHSGNGIASFSQEYRVFSKRGEIRWLDDRTWVRSNDRGEITHYQGIVMDITERKLAAGRQTAIMDGLRAVLELADYLMAAPTIDELFMRAVTSSREKLGLERTAIMTVEGDGIHGTYGTNLKGQTSREATHFIELDEKWRERLRPRKPGEKPWLIVSEPYFEWDGVGMVGLGRGWVALTPIVAHKGVIGFFCNDSAISGAPVDEVKQEITAVFCAMIGNIIARRRAEEEQRNVQEQHRDFMERTDRLNSLGMLAAGMAHEINNPLQGMLSHLHFVQKAIRKDEKALASLVMVEKGIDAIATLVRKLLILGRSHDQESEMVECGETIEFVTQLLASQFKRTKVTFAIAINTPGMTLAMPRRYLTQVLMNLLINARDAMPGGGVIDITVEAHDDTGWITIADTGMGIPATELPQIFKPFHTTKGAKGTGLGLSVADSLVRTSKGAIEVSSEPGKTSFTLKVPLARSIKDE